MPDVLFAGLMQDVRYAVRLLHRQPGFAAVAILTMALGIGATTMLFSVAYGVLLKLLPWSDAAHLVRVTETRQGRTGRVLGTVSNGTFLAWRDHRSTIEVLLASVVLLLVTATANVASLQLARATVRRREMAVRAAIGAGQRRVIRQLLIESGIVGLLGGAAGLALRTTADPTAYVSTLRGVVHEEAPTLALDSVMTMEDRVMTSLEKPRLYAVVLAWFGMFALLVAGAGLFGVLSLSVAQRTREIGVRAALGAQARDIVRLVLRQALWSVGLGVLIGVGAALAGVRLLPAFLYGISPYDALTFVGVPIVIVAIAAVACLVPASRAAKVDPHSRRRSLLWTSRRRFDAKRSSTFSALTSQISASWLTASPTSHG